MAKVGCAGCRDANANAFDIPFTMAFQPIVDLKLRRIWGHEALIRGRDGESAYQVLSRVTEQNRYAFDQACRVTAIELAGEKLPASSTCMLSINFMPNAVYEPKACIRATLAAAARVRFSPQRLMFEFVEDEKIQDPTHISTIVNEYRRMGFTTAVDDFGAGYANLTLLAKFQPDILKLDMDLVRDIDTSPSRQAIVSGIMAMSRLIGIKVLAEGVETEGETRSLLDLGVNLFQGYYFAKPALEAFVEEGDIPALTTGFTGDAAITERAGDPAHAAGKVAAA